MIELKPCPFCGRPAKLFASTDGICVKCTGCKCQTEFLQDRIDRNMRFEFRWEVCEGSVTDGVIAKWNSRV